MKKTIVTIALFIATANAMASCPFGTVYRCYQGMNGKMVCGCF